MFKSFIAASLALAVAAGPALAGGLAPAVESQPVVINEAEVAPRATTGVLVPLLLLGALVAVAAASDDDDDDRTGGGNKGGGGKEPPQEPEEPEQPPTTPDKDWGSYCAANPSYNGPQC